MSQRFDVEVFDVTVDGFPADGEVGFFWGGSIYSGWPLIDRDNSYPGQSSFATPEQAKSGPLNVLWEASEDRVSGDFSGVRHWFRIPDPKPIRSDVMPAVTWDQRAEDLDAARGRREPFLPGDLEDRAHADMCEDGNRRWHAEALEELARQLGVGNDFYYPLLGAATLIDGQSSRRREK